MAIDITALSAVVDATGTQLTVTFDMGGDSYADGGGLGSLTDHSLTEIVESAGASLTYTIGETVYSGETSLFYTLPEGDLRDDGADLNVAINIAVTNNSTQENAAVALGNTLKLLPGSGMADSVTPTSVVAGWITVIDADTDASVAGLDSATGSGNIDVDTDITRSRFHKFTRDNALGTTVYARMKYDDGITVSTDPVVRLFGRKKTDDNSENWQLLRNLNNQTDVTIEADEANDVTDGTDNWTSVENSAHGWDCNGCDEFIFGVITPIAVSAGNADLASLEAKIV